MGRYTYPHIIENGAGERLIFLRRVAGTRGERVEGRTSSRPVPVRRCTSTATRKVFTVRHGRIGYQRPGEPPHFAGPGETVAFKAGEPHRFWNAGEGDLRCTAHLEPADNAEYLLKEIFESTRRNGGARPDPFDAAFLMTRYRSEFAMVDVPAIVQRVVFPVLVAVGKVLGRYRKYADAPEPVRR